MDKTALYTTPQGARVRCTVMSDGSARCIAIGKLWPGFRRELRTVDAATFSTFKVES